MLFVHSKTVAKYISYCFSHEFLSYYLLFSFSLFDKLCVCEATRTVQIEKVQC